jgi:hypothetical protein
MSRLIKYGHAAGHVRDAASAAFEAWASWNGRDPEPKSTTSHIKSRFPGLASWCGIAPTSSQEQSSTGFSLRDSGSSGARTRPAPGPSLRTSSDELQRLKLAHHGGGRRGAPSRVDYVERVGSDTDRALTRETEAPLHAGDRLEIKRRSRGGEAIMWSLGRTPCRSGLVYLIS